MKFCKLCQKYAATCVHICHRGGTKQHLGSHLGKKRTNQEFILVYALLFREGYRESNKKWKLTIGLAADKTSQIVCPLYGNELF